MRLKFLYFLRFSVSKVPENEINPKWINFIGYLLFPINSFLFQRFDYDAVSDSIFIYGRRYSRMFFAMIGYNNAHGQEWFQFVRNKDTGIVELYKKVDTDFIHKDIVEEELDRLQNENESLNREIEHLRNMFNNMSSSGNS